MQTKTKNPADIGTIFGILISHAFSSACVFSFLVKFRLTTKQIYKIVFIYLHH